MPRRQRQRSARRSAARPPRADQTPAAPAPPTEPRAACSTDLAPVPNRRPGQQHRRRPGAIPALSGRPRRRALHRRAVRARTIPAATGCFTSTADNVGYRDQRYLGDVSAHRPFRRLRPVGRDSAVLQRRHEDAVHGRRAARCVLDDATQRAIQSGPGEAQSSYVPIAPQFDLRERRDIGTRRPHSDTDAESRHHGELHDHTAHAASCPGAGRSASRTTSRCRCRTTRGPTSSRSAPNGPTAATCCASATTARGSTIWTTRSSGTARFGWTTRPSAPGRGRMALWPTNSAQTDQRGGYTEVRAPHAAHRLRVVRLLEQQPAAAAVHDQLRAAADRAAEGDGARPRPTSSRRNLNLRHASGDRVAVQRTVPRLQLQQRDAADRHHRSTSAYDTSVGTVVDRRAGALRAQPDERSTPTRRGADSSRSR